ncbi:MAG: hypothetical protein HY652_14325 [Acidobacteria bacterium]|nr:hypothetical protein [Acidobacteriota bacterium]
MLVAWVVLLVLALGVGPVRAAGGVLEGVQWQRDQWLHHAGTLEETKEIYDKTGKLLKRDTFVAQVTYGLSHTSPTFLVQVKTPVGKRINRSNLYEVRGFATVFSGLAEREYQVEQLSEDTFRVTPPEWKVPSNGLDGFEGVVRVNEGQVETMHGLLKHTKYRNLFSAQFVPVNGQNGVVYLPSRVEVQARIGSWGRERQAKLILVFKDWLDLRNLPREVEGPGTADSVSPVSLVKARRRGGR